MEPFEIIGAFVDGERVDPEALKTALSTDEGRQYLVDVTLLREMTLADGYISSLGAAALTKPALAAPNIPPAVAYRRWMAPFAAAAAVILALTGGYVAGRHSAPSTSRGRELASAGENQPAPAPTSIIRLKPGVDWHEQTPRNSP